MVFDEFITTTTQDKILPKVMDSVLAGNVITLRLMTNSKKWMGETLKVPVKVSSSSTGGSYDGYDTFTTTRANTRINMSFNPKAYYQTVTLSNMEKAVNTGEEAVIDLLTVEMESAQQDMIDGIGDLMYGDGTGNGNKDFTGLVAAVDDGTNVATYGGQSRTTYTTLQGNYTATVGNLTLSGMATMYDSCTVGTDVPSLIVTTETVWTYYESLLTPTMSANYNMQSLPMVTSTGINPASQGFAGGSGFVALMFRGTPVVKDEKCTAGYMYFLNEKYLDFHALGHPENIAIKPMSNTIDGVYSQAGSNIPVFYWSGWLKPTNQDARTGHFTVYGDLINKNPNRSGVLRGITGV